MANSNGLHSSVQKPPFVDLHLDEVKETIETELSRAAEVVTSAAQKVEKTAKANPKAAAGILLGVGALLGALAYAVLRPAPTAGEVIMRALKQGAKSTGDTLSSGYKSARRAIG